MSTALHRQMLEFNYGDDERGALMREIWQSTPWMINIKVGDARYAVSARIRAWCEEHVGTEAWPIGGIEGDWQFGGVVIFGWAWIGFVKESQMRQFMEAFPECEPNEGER